MNVIAIFVLAASHLALALTASPQDQDVPSVWTGEPRAELTVELRQAMALPAADLSKQVARVMLRLKANRDFEAAWTELAALRLRAARESTLDQDLLLAITQARVEIKMTLGQLAEARGAAGCPLPTASELQSTLDPTTVSAAPAPWLEKLLSRTSELTHADGAASASELPTAPGPNGWLRARLDPEEIAYLERTCGTPGREMLNFVERELYLPNLNINHRQKVEALGLQVSSALSLLVLEDPGFENPKGLDVDPFDVLIDVDEGAAARLAVDLLTRAGDALRWRVLHWIEASRRLRGARGWLPGPFGTVVLSSQARHPEWLQVLADLLPRERFRAQALEAMVDVSHWDGISATLADSLVQLITNDDAAVARQVLNALRQPHGVPSAVPVYLAGMRSSAVDVRQECAQRLAALQAPPREFLGHGADSDPIVRGFVAEALGAATVDVRVWHDDLSGKVVSVERVGHFGAEELATLEVFLQDPDERVRTKALDALASRGEIYNSLYEIAGSSSVAAVRTQVADHVASWYREGTPGSTSMLAQLLADSDALVRAAVVSTLSKLSASAQVRIVSALAQDTEPSVLAVLDRMLTRPSRFMYAEAFIAGLSQRVSNRSVPFLPHAGTAAGWAQVLKHGYTDMPGLPVALALLGAGLEEGDDEFIAASLGPFLLPWLSRAVSVEDASKPLLGLGASQRAALYDWGETSLLANDNLAYFVLSNPRDRGDVEACSLRLGGSERLEKWVWESTALGIDAGARELEALSMAVFRDRNRPVSARLGAASMVDTLNTDGDVRTVIGVLRGIDPAGNQDELELVAGVAEGPCNGNLLLLAAVDDGGVQEPVLSRLAGGFDGTQDGADDASVAILARGLGRASEVVDAAIRHLGASPIALEHADLLITASRDPSHVFAAVEAMERHMDPRFLDALRVSLSLGPMVRHKSEHSFRESERAKPSHEIPAIQAIMRYPAASAAEQLRQALLATDGDGREMILGALDSLDRYWELERASENRAVGTRDEALSELVEMLSSEDATLRAEAAGCVAAFGALEVLPRLIPMLQDSDPAVRAAARAAIDQLRRG